MTFSKALTYWSVHAVFCATPNFLLAYSSGFNSLAAVLGMSVAVIVFIALYAAVSSSHFYIDKSVRVGFGRVVHIAASIRSLISGVGLVAIIVQMYLKSGVYVTHSSGLEILFLPDLMAGILALACSAALFEFFGVSLVSAGSFSEVRSFFLGGETAFLPTLVTTLFEGAILTVTLLMLVALVFLCVRTWRRIKPSVESTSI